jgi:hypothetical protein
MVVVEMEAAGVVSIETVVERRETERGERGSNYV